MNENFFRKIHRKGIVTIAAAGNNGHIDDAPPMIPAAFPTSTISIGAVNLQKKRHYMSAVNFQVEFCAAGTDIISTGFELVNGRYYWDYEKKNRLLNGRSSSGRGGFSPLVTLPSLFRRSNPFCPS